MNHLKIYENIINNAKFRALNNPLIGYKERHHIIPKCLLGSDKPENLVDLTAKEHFICHALLCHIYPMNNKLIMAFNMMCNCKTANQYRYISSSKYQKFRDIANKAISLTLKGKVYSDEYKLNMSKSITNSLYTTSGQRSRDRTERMKGNNFNLGRKFPKVECIYCKVITTVPTISRCHGPAPSSIKIDSNKSKCRIKSLEIGTSW